jgi:hypothetical protein
MAEVVRTLEADAATDWSKVDMERLRQHLIDMDEVVLRASVKATQVPGGLSMDVTGEGRTVRSIRDMVIPHAAELDGMPAWSAKAEPIPDGVRLIVAARDAADPKTAARIRGLGFAGLLVQGGHHGPHHLAMARERCRPRTSIRPADSRRQRHPHPGPLPLRGRGWHFDSLAPGRGRGPQFELSRSAARRGLSK